MKAFDLPASGGGVQCWTDPTVVGGIDGDAGWHDLVDAVENVRGQVRVGRGELRFRWSMVRGPMMTAVMAGWRMTNAIASWTSGTSAFSASWASCSAASNLRWFSASDRSRRLTSRCRPQTRTLNLSVLAVSAGQPSTRERAARRSHPFRTGRRWAGRPFRSPRRESCRRLFGPEPLRWQSRAIHCASTIADAGNVESPRYRIFPARTDR